SSLGRLSSIQSASSYGVLFFFLFFIIIVSSCPARISSTFLLLSSVFLYFCGWEMYQKYRDVTWFTLRDVVTMVITDRRREEKRTNKRQRRRREEIVMEDEKSIYEMQATKR
ncbi:hypothetical protein TRV_02901, partial [Trichophyton verrucosum HKI 0517]